MVTSAYVLGLVILVCVTIIALVATIACCYLAWDEVDRLRRRRRSVASMDDRLEEWLQHEAVERD